MPTSSSKQKWGRSLMSLSSSIGDLKNICKKNCLPSCLGWLYFLEFLDYTTVDFPWMCKHLIFECLNYNSWSNVLYCQGLSSSLWQKAHFIFKKLNWPDILCLLQLKLQESEFARCRAEGELNDIRMVMFFNYTCTYRYSVVPKTL